MPHTRWRSFRAMPIWPPSRGSHGSCCIGWLSDVSFFHIKKIWRPRCEMPAAGIFFCINKIIIAAYFNNCCRMKIAVQCTIESVGCGRGEKQFQLVKLIRIADLQ